MRQNIGEHLPIDIQVGQTTRADLILALGEPDFSDMAERRLLWVAGRAKGGVPFVWGIGAGYTAAAGAFAIERVDYARLIVWFDRDGKVERKRQDFRWCVEASGVPNGGDPSPDGGTGSHPCVGTKWVMGADADATPR
jgi:hypothetical protein